MAGHHELSLSFGRLLSVQDLATRFADGRLSNGKILNAEDEELYELLTAVRGIGKVELDSSLPTIKA